MTESKNITSTSDQTAQISKEDPPTIDEAMDIALLSFFNYLVRSGADQVEAAQVVAVELDRFRHPPSKRRLTLRNNRLVPIDAPTEAPALIVQSSEASKKACRGTVAAEASLNEVLRAERLASWKSAKDEAELLRAKALTAQLLAPAPDAASVLWKRRTVEGMNGRDLVGATLQQIEKAIADDEAFLKFHPSRWQISEGSRAFLQNCRQAEVRARND
jgi:hypothetical protein